MAPISKAVRRLARKLTDRRAPHPAVRLRQATVVARTTTTVDLQLGGDTSTTLTGIRWLGESIPQVGETVWVAQQGPDLAGLARHVGPREQEGTVVVTLPAGDDSTETAVTFPVSWPAGITPRVWVSVGTFGYLASKAVDPTNTGFLCNVFDTRGVRETGDRNVTVYWLARG